MPYRINPITGQFSLIGESDISIYDSGSDGMVDATESVRQMRLAGVGGIGGHRVVVVGTDGRLEYASSDNSNHADRVVGITVNAGLENISVTYISSGRIIESSWAWSVGDPVYLGLNGLLTQVVPSSGHLTVVGVAVSATEILVSIKQSIVRG